MMLPAERVFRSAPTAESTRIAALMVEVAIVRVGRARFDFKARRA